MSIAMGGEPLSEQAVELHVRALTASIAAKKAGFLSLRSASVLAAETGALVDELVDAGCWGRVARGYVLHAGVLSASGEIVDATPETAPAEVVSLVPPHASRAILPAALVPEPPEGPQRTML